ncbi:MAG: RNA ligase [Flavobacterium sp.]
MEVIKFLKANGNNFQKLTEAYGVKVKDYPEHKLVVLNYDQINSPKMEPVVQECRGLILDYALDVVCRPFDRFFNYGEAETDKMDLTGYTYFPKLDGSLIKVYYWNKSWRIATRGTAFAESDVGGWGITFEQLALKAADCKDIEEFNARCRCAMFDTNETYLFELTAMENRVVTQYNTPQLTLLSVRNNLTGKFVNTKYEVSLPTDFYRVNTFIDGLSINDIIQKADSLKNLEEGFVGYDKEGIPRVKVKSAAYVAVHHIRGEGLNPKRIAELVISGEGEEYLTYFPEDRDTITPYSVALEGLLTKLIDVMMIYRTVEDQKEFALAIKDVQGKSVLFTARKYNISVQEAFQRGTINSKVDMLLSLMK